MVSILLTYIYIFLASLYNMWDLSSPTRDQTCTPCSGSTESLPLDCQRSLLTYFKMHNTVLTISTTLHSTSLELIHLVYMKRYTHKVTIPHFSLSPLPGNCHSILCFPVFDSFRYLISGIMQYLFFCDYLISLNMMSSRFMHVATDDKIFFSFKAEKYSVVYKYYIFFIYSSINGHCFHVLAMINNAAVNMRHRYC